MLYVVLLLLFFVLFTFLLYRFALNRKPLVEESWIQWARRNASTKNLPSILKDAVANTAATLISIPPKKLAGFLSPDAQALLASCYVDLDRSKIWDYHTHLFGTGFCCESGNYIPEKEERTLKVMTVGRVMLKASGCRSEETADKDFVDMLSRLSHAKHCLLAFDKHYTKDGTVDEEKTHIYTSNEWVLRVADMYPNSFIPSCSVHPYRKDALDELERANKHGVKLIKWLPNSMGIDGLDPVCEPFYKKVAEYGMVILAHAGEEKAVEADPQLQELGNPLRMRKALQMGCKLIIAHVGTLGVATDLDSTLDPKPQVPCFDLVLRILREKQWDGRVWSDISAITLMNRMKYCHQIIASSDIHHKLIYGSDYPLTNIRALNLTLPFQTAGLITSHERACLNEIYEYNPLLFDFALKRTMKGKNGERLPPAVFMRRKEIF